MVARSVDAGAMDKAEDAMALSQRGGGSGSRMNVRSIGLELQSARVTGGAGGRGRIRRLR